MQEKITFGKFEGFSPLELAQAGEAGRNYLSWGAEHLKSPKWRRAFEGALRANVKPDINLMARAILKEGASDLGYDEALELARCELEQQEENNTLLEAIEGRQGAVVAHWAQIMGIAPEKLRALARRYEFGEWDQLPASHFSSQEMHQHFMAMMEAWMQAYDE